MNKRLRAFASMIFLFTQTLSPLPAYAKQFSDVSVTHSFAAEISVLSDMEIIKGNPDGSFKPGNTINRAELLTLLYRAKGRNPAEPSKGCFPDVPSGAWFSAVVCDSAKRGYVGGYADGKFQPGKDVNRAEALKMILMVFGISPKSNVVSADLGTYKDVPLDAWYAQYVAAALTENILPIAGVDGTSLSPDRALTRGEAAALIFNALDLTIPQSSSSARSRSSSSAVSSLGAGEIEVDFPFGDDGTFKEKKSKVYVFDLSKNTTAWLDAETSAGNAVQCRLYKIEAETSFAIEYYIGHQSANHCSMRVSLASGSYQFEVTPRASNLPFSLSTKVVTGDGNDGFREASLLVKNSPKTGYLEDEDYSEWYYFKLTKETQLTVDVSNESDMSCLIYPMEDVDLYGFSGPVCNESYLFPAGTYYIGVMKHAEKDGKQSFTIRYH